MKKLFGVLSVITALGLGGYVFRSDIAKTLAGQANTQLANGLDELLARQGVAPEAAAQIRAITRKMDAKLVLELLADPKAFVNGASGPAKQFMSTPAGAQLAELLRAHAKL